ncbi:putative ATP synthase subunit delta [[Clostridium] ultunense Esp]|uniref:ATP synthase F1 subunit delta n=1 Tax=Thermicanus aegyptius TaxID=94009 RepID=UPI0002B6F9B0|nr:ATP synthase F1 subunit delta [Thermicanus aegyptius]CCQ94971.1 putative ATP synthase subunit delta [[Clostridium] ultunense Esp]
MSKLSLARPYAKALFLAAQEKKILGPIREGFSRFILRLEEEPDARRLLAHPQVTLEDKKRIILSLAGDAHPYLKNFLSIMVDNGRETLFKTVYESFLRLVDEKEGWVEAVITTAKPLSKEEEQKIISLFQEKTGKTIRAKTRTDEALLGGVVVRIGDTLYDGSIRTQLVKLKERFLEKRA